MKLLLFPFGSIKLVVLAEGFFRSKSEGTFCLCKWLGWGMASPQHANDLGVAFVQFFAGHSVWDLFWGGGVSCQDSVNAVGIRINP